MNIFAKWRAIIEAPEVEMIRGQRMFVVEVYREDSNNLSPTQTRIADVILACFENCGIRLAWNSEEKMVLNSEYLFLQPLFCRVVSTLQCLHWLPMSWGSSVGVSDMWKVMGNYCMLGLCRPKKWWNETPAPLVGLDVDAEKEIPSCELIATKCIGSGVTSEVYQGHWTRIGKARARNMWSKW